MNRLSKLELWAGSLPIRCAVEIALVLFLALVLALMARPARAADPTPYQALLNKAGEIRAADNATLQAFAAAQKERETERAPSLLACSKLTNDIVQALCVLGVNGNLAGGTGGLASAGAPGLPAMNLPGPPPEPEGWGSKAWNATLAVADRALTFFGVRETRRAQVDIAAINAGVQIAQSGHQAATTTALANGQTQLGLGLANVIGTVASAPRAPGTQITLDATSGNVLLGNGNLTVAPVTGSYNPVNPAPVVCAPGTTGPNCSRGP